MQYAYANIFTLPFSMPSYGREREYFIFVSKQKIFPNNGHEDKIKDKQYFSKLISLFWKQWEGEESLFLKEKQEAHLYVNALYFFNFLKT